METLPDTNLLSNIDAAFAKLPKLRDESHYSMLGAARAIEQFVLCREPERVIQQALINSVFKCLYPFVTTPDAPFPRYFTAQAGRFLGNRLYLRCDDKERSVFVLEDGSEEDAGPGCRYGACIHMACNGDWQEILERQAKELLTVEDK